MALPAIRRETHTAPSGCIELDTSNTVKLSGSPLYQIYYVQSGDIIVDRSKDKRPTSTIFFRGPTLLGALPQQQAETETLLIKALSPVKVEMFDRTLLDAAVPVEKFLDAQANDKIQLSTLIETLLTRSVHLRTIGALNILTSNGESPSPLLKGTEIARLIGTTQPNISREIAALQRSGSIKKTNSDAQNGSQYEITLRGLRSDFADPQVSLYDEDLQYVQTFQQFICENPQLTVYAGILQSYKVATTRFIHALEFLIPPGEKKTSAIQQDKVGDFIGMTRGQTNSALNELRRKGFIDYSTGGGTAKSYELTPLGVAALNYLKDGISPARARRLLTI